MKHKRIFFGSFLVLVLTVFGIGNAAQSAPAKLPAGVEAADQKMQAVAEGLLNPGKVAGMEISVSRSVPPYVSGYWQDEVSAGPFVLKQDKGKWSVLYFDGGVPSESVLRSNGVPRETALKLFDKLTQ